MATYSDAEATMRQLRKIINKCIAEHPLVKSAIKAQKAVVWAAPNTSEHTVAIKFLPDIFDKEGAPLTFPYNPKIPVSDLAKGKTVYVWYYQSLSNGVVMQNATWSI